MNPLPPTAPHPRSTNVTPGATKPVCVAPQIPGPGLWASQGIQNVVAASAAALLVALAMAIGSRHMGYNWQWYRVPQYLWTADGSPGPLILGLGMTLRISAVGLVLASIVGLATALARLSPWRSLRGLAIVYLELVRNTPLFIQILFLYFVLGPLLGLERATAGILALTFFEGAYASEIIRAGIVSIPSGQWEAAYSLGLSTAHTYRQVILPQALRRTVPALTGQAVSLVKDSSLLSIISIFELTMHGKLIVADTFMTFEIWFTVAAIYLVLNLCLSACAAWLETRMAVAA